MSKRFLSRSLFRPARKGSINPCSPRTKPLVRSLERRLFLRQGLSLGALTLLTGCDISNKESVQAVLKGLLALERPGAGVALRPDEARADLLGGRGAEAAAFQRLLQHR